MDTKGDRIYTPKIRVRVRVRQRSILEPSPAQESNGKVKTRRHSRQVRVQLIKIKHEHMILHPAPYALQVHFTSAFDAHFLEVRLGPDTGVHEDDGGVVRACGEYDLFSGFDDLCRALWLRSGGRGRRVGGERERGEVGWEERRGFHAHRLPLRRRLFRIRVFFSDDGLQNNLRNNRPVHNAQVRRTRRIINEIRAARAISLMHRARHMADALAFARDEHVFFVLEAGMGDVRLDDGFADRREGVHCCVQGTGVAVVGERGGEAFCWYELLRLRSTCSIGRICGGINVELGI